MLEVHTSVGLFQKSEGVVKDREGGPVQKNIVFPQPDYLPDLVQACQSRAKHVVGEFEEAELMRMFDRKNGGFPPNQPDRKFIRYLVCQQILPCVRVQINCGDCSCRFKSVSVEMCSRGLYDMMSSMYGMTTLRPGFITESSNVAKEAGTARLLCLRTAQYNTWVSENENVAPIVTHVRHGLGLPHK